MSSIAVGFIGFIIGQFATRDDGKRQIRIPQSTFRNYDAAMGTHGAT